MLNLCWHYIHGTDNLRVLDAFHLYAVGIFYLFFFSIIKMRDNPPEKKKKEKLLLTFVFHATLLLNPQT